MRLSKQRREIGRVIRRFLNAWQQEDWEAMYRSAQLTWASKPDNTAAALEAMVGDTPLANYEVLTIGNPKDGMADVGLKLRITSPGAENPRVFTVRARLAQEAGPYKPSSSGKWGVNPLSILRMQPVEGE